MEEAFEKVEIDEEVEIEGFKLVLIKNHCTEKYKTCVYCFFGGYDDGESKYCCENYWEIDCKNKKYVYTEVDWNV